MQDHNWFAFKDHRRGYCISKSRGNYCVYASVDSALAEYRIFEREKIIKHSLYTEELYRKWVKRHYATDPLYGWKLNRAIKQTQHL